MSTVLATELMRDFESWEDTYDFHERRDYEGLVAYCEDDVRRSPEDVYAAERLTDAYVLNGNYERAINFGAKIHKDYPEISCFQHYILVIVGDGPETAEITVARRQYRTSQIHP